MEMTFRWFGTGHDTITLKQIRQIPGVTGVITTLYDTTPGEVWSREKIHALKQEVEAAGLHISGIESVNIHDSIKIGSPDREQYIDNYIETLRNLGKEGIHLVCYNFMPVFDWTRTELARKRPDGSTVLAYTQAAVDAINPENMVKQSQFAEAINIIAPEYQFEVIDFYNANILNSHDPDINALYVTDGIHCNKEGYKIMAEHVASQLIQRIEQ